MTVRAIKQEKVAGAKPVEVQKVYDIKPGDLLPMRQAAEKFGFTYPQLKWWRLQSRSNPLAYPRFIPIGHRIYLHKDEMADFVNREISKTYGKAANL